MRKSIFVDLLSMIPGWLILLIVDPLISTVIGIPVSLVLILLRRTLWVDRPVRGRIVCGTVMPLIGLSAALSVAFGLGVPLLGILLSAALLIAVEVWNLRSGKIFAQKFPLTLGVFFVLLSIILTTLLLLGDIIGYPSEELSKAWSPANTPPTWSQTARQDAVALAREAVKNDSEFSDKLYSAAVKRYPALANSQTVRGVFVTLFSNGYASRGTGNQGDAIKDIIAAATAAKRASPKRPRSNSVATWKWSSHLDKTIIHVDVPGKNRALPRRLFFDFFGELFRKADKSLKRTPHLSKLLNDIMSLEIGVDGIEIIAPNGKIATVLPCEPVTLGWLTPRIRTGANKLAQLISRGWKREHGVRPKKDETFELKKFRTINFGEITPKGKVIDFYRGNTLLQDSLSRKLLIKRLALGINWLSSMVQPNGKFYYEIFPPYKKKTHGYNLPRHAGSVYGLFAAYNRKEPELRKAGDKALTAGLLSLSYLISNLKSPDAEAAPNMRCFVDKKNSAESGSTALSVMSLCELPSPSANMSPRLQNKIKSIDKNGLLTSMGACMLAMIDSDGAVFESYKEAISNKKVTEEPLYYPGEVALALIRSYKQTGETKLLEGAVKIADRQLAKYNWAMTLDFPWPGDHWIIQALTELSKETLNMNYARLAVLMGKGYMREQYPPQKYLYPDYKGAYRRIVDLPRTTRAASRGEALGAALQSAKLLNIDTKQFRRALIEGARHLIEQQFVTSNSYFIPANFKTLGGFRMGLVDNHLRIDNNQHAIIALIAALDAMNEEF